MPPQVTQAGARVPLVIVLHGGGGNGKKAARITNFSGKAEREGFIVAYPNGTTGGLGPLTWNAGHCCAYAMRENIDDVGFIGAMIDRMVSELPVDPRRVYVTGMTNGAMMTHRLGIGLSGKIAAIAPVVGALFGDENQPAWPVPVLIINGGIDKRIYPEGGHPVTGPLSDASDANPAPAAYQGEFWAKVNGCKPQPEELARQGSNPVAVWRYDCPPGREVMRYLVLDNAHAWPGGEKGRSRSDAPSMAMNATDVIWDFFKTHRR